MKSFLSFNIERTIHIFIINYYCKLAIIYIISFYFIFEKYFGIILHIANNILDIETLHNNTSPTEQFLSKIVNIII